jgi:hypothetical protein
MSLCTSYTGKRFFPPPLPLIIVRHSTEVHVCETHCTTFSSAILIQNIKCLFCLENVLAKPIHTCCFFVTLFFSGMTQRYSIRQAIKLEV